MNLNSFNQVSNDRVIHNNTMLVFFIYLKFDELVTSVEVVFKLMFSKFRGSAYGDIVCVYEAYTTEHTALYGFYTVMQWKNFD